MTEYNAGRARATYEVGYEPFRRAAREIIELWRRIRDAQLQAQRLPAGPAAGGANGTAALQAASRFRNLSAEQQRVIQNALRLAAAEARAEAAIARSAAASSRAAAAHASAAAAQDRAALSAQRRADFEARAAQRTTAGGNGASAIAGALGNLAGPVAGLFGVSQIAAFTGQAVAAANTLEDVQQSLRVVARDQETYNKALQAARDAQRLFGGTLADNISDLQGFVLTSRTAGVSLDSLVLVSRQLALLDPAQGLRGASIALREFLSGNITSLAQRFELPRTVLRTLGDQTATTADKLQALSQFLEGAGISAAAIEGRLDNTSQSYRDLGVAGEEALTRLGGAVARNGRGITEFLTEGLEGLNQLLSIGERADAASAAILAGSADYDTYRARVEAANAGLSDFGASISLLSREAFASQKIIQQQGGAIVDASVNAERYAATTDIVAFTQQTLATRIREGFDASQLSAQAQADLGAEMIRLAGTSEQNRATIEALNVAYQNGAVLADGSRFSAEQLRAAVEAVALANEAAANSSQNLATGDIAVAQAAQETARANREAAEAAQEQAIKQTEQGLVADIARIKNEQLQAELLRAAQGAEAVDAAANRIAAAYDETEAPALARIIGLLREKLALEGANERRENRVPPSSRPGFGGTAPADVARSEQVAQRSQEFVKSQADAAGQLAIVRSQLRAVTAGTAEYYQLKGEEARLNAQIAADRERTATRAGRTAQRQANAEAREAERAREAAQRELERRQEEIARAYQRIEDRTRDHYRRLRQASEDYTVESSRAEEDFQREKQRLLAEGQIAEARALEEEFRIAQRRRREDRDREAQRTTEDFGTDVSDIARDAQLGNVRPLGPATAGGLPLGLPQGQGLPGAVPGAGLPVLLPTAAALPGPMVIQLQIAQTVASVNLDGGEVGEIVYPAIRATLEADIATGRISTDNPAVGGQILGVGGPRS